MKVFLSYSRRDAEFVDRLDDGLNALGYDVWIDREDIGSSQEDRWRRSVVKAIRESDVVVLVLSPNSTNSESVERELTVAADNSKRVVPVLHRECELPDGFQYELAGIQYVDFTQLDFDVGVRRLATQIGPAPTFVVDSPITDTAAVESGPRNDDGEPHAVRRPGVFIVGAGLLLLAIGVGVVALTRSDDGEATPSTTVSSENASVTAVAIVEQPGTESAVAITTGASEQEQAKALVDAWADATTRRDFAEVARIDPSRSPEELVTLYGATDSPVRMFSMKPYIADVAQDGPLWRLTGAAFAWDFNPEPAVRTHVICSEWSVDLASGSATWVTGKDQFIPDRQLDVDQFLETYANTCT